MEVMGKWRTSSLMKAYLGLQKLGAERTRTKPKAYNPFNNGLQYARN